LKQPIKVYNVDGTRNKEGIIDHIAKTDIQISGHKTETELLATGLGKESVILGMPWLRKVNPIIDWSKGTMEIPDRSETLEDICATLLEPEEELKDDEILLAYTQGEPILGIMDPGKQPLSHEYKEPRYKRTQKGANIFIGHITVNHQSARYSFAQNVWIQAKSTPSQQFGHKDKKEINLDDHLPAYCQQYREVFEKTAAERFPQRRPWDHAIDLKPDFIAKDCKIYPLSPLEQKEQSKFIKENLEKGYIQKSISPQASPFFFVGKKEEGELRPCQDYRYLNEGTIKNAYPIPLVSELTDKLKEAKIFTKLDLRWGYNNVRIKKGDEWKAAFKTNEGLFEPRVMFFGLCNSPATFQNMMNDIFRDMIDEGWLVIYIDDMLLFSKDPKEHRERTLRVLQRLKENDLFLKGEKCKFDVTEVEFLGMILRPGEIAMDPSKLAGIKDWPTPSNLKAVRSYLGFCNFYRRFIPYYSDIARPLNDLTRKDRQWKWTTECQKSFDTLKQRFGEAPVLKMPDSFKPFIIESDASKFATGAVLRQQDINGDWHPCGYISQSLNPAERNYQIYDRELLGVVRALATWRHYLHGSPHPVTMLSDHKNLTYFRTAQKLNPRQARWSLLLSQFNMKLVHVPGSRMVQSDGLSRREDFNPGKDDENEDAVMLPENLFVKTMDTDLQGHILTVMDKDDIITKALEALKTGGIPPMRSKLTDWKINDGMVFYKERCYVPPNEELRRKIVQRYHDAPTMGHPGRFKTLELLRRDYWWPGDYTFVKNYVDGCGICQQMKINTHPTTPPLMPIRGPTSTRPFSQISCDFITDLPESSGYDALMVVVDHGLTKGVILIPCTKTITAEQTALKLHENLYRRFGLSDKFISDRGPQFNSAVFKEWGRLLGTKIAMSTAYHPQTDGETERTNQEIEAYLRIYCGNNPNSWASHLSNLEFSHNNRVHSARNASPFYLMMGYNPKMLPIPYVRSPVPEVQHRLKELQRARDEALAAHELTRQRMAERITRGFKLFRKGDQVWLDNKNLKLPYPTRKLAPKREGPFEIIEVLGPLTYKLKLPATWRIHNVFHATLLVPYKENLTHGTNFLRPPPDIINDEEEWEVEAILKHRDTGRRNNRVRQYWIKWKGWETNNNTWEPEAMLGHSKELLQEYKNLHHLS